MRTKLYPPAQPADLVVRENLLEQPEARKTRPLALISAPADYGKSLLISSWLARCDWTSAWLSLEEDDSDLRQFLSDLLAAVRSGFPEACEPSRLQAMASELPPVASVAASLTNDLDALPQPLVLVLDDYHRITAGSPVNELLERLLAFPPIPMHLVVIQK